MRTHGDLRGRRHGGFARLHLIGAAAIRVQRVVGESGYRCVAGGIAVAKTLSRTPPWSRVAHAALRGAVGVALTLVLVACGANGAAERSEAAQTNVFGRKVTVGTVQEVRSLLASQRYVRSDAGRFYLLPATDDAVIAVYWRDPTDGCTLPPPRYENASMQQVILQTVCDGTIYSERTGVAVRGRGVRPLDFMPVSVENGRVIVDTGKVTQRGSYDPSQSTKLS